MQINLDFVREKLSSDNSDIDCALLFYVYKDSNDIHNINKVAVNLKDELEFNKTISSVQNQEGFLFFSIEPEGELWFKDNDNVLKNLWVNYVISLNFN